MISIDPQTNRKTSPSFIVICFFRKYNGFPQMGLEWLDSNLDKNIKRNQAGLKIEVGFLQVNAVKHRGDTSWV